MYNIAIETAEGVKPYGYHLGTILSVAEEIILEKLKNPEIKSIALYEGSAIKGFPGKLIRIYDFRDLD